MKEEHHKQAYLILIVLVIAVALMVIYSPRAKEYFSNPEEVKMNIGRFGYFAPLVFILIQALQCTIAPFPGQILAIASGYLFGPWLGTLYCIIGLGAGSSLDFFLARRFGRKVLELFVSRKEVFHINHFFQKKGNVALLLAYLSPIFPNDSLSFMSGVLKIRYWTFILITTIGYIPSVLIYNFFGNEILTEGFSALAIVLIALINIILVTFLFKERIKYYSLKELHYFEKEARIIEKEFEKDVFG